VSPVRYELGFYIPEDDVLLSHRREHLKSYIIESFSSVVFVSYGFDTECSLFSSY
jgi:hypothetical protein